MNTVTFRDLDRLGEQITYGASRSATLFWLDVMRRLEEEDMDPAARWETLRIAMTRVGRQLA